MKIYLKNLSTKFNLAVVGGSDICKAKEQLGESNN